MYDASDPRSTLASTASAEVARHSVYTAEQAGLFYETPPQLDDANGKMWVTRGQNFVIAYHGAARGAVFRRDHQDDEYVVLIPDATTKVEVSTGADAQTIPGYSIVIVPPGPSVVRVLEEGPVVRLLTPRAVDLAALSSNASEFTDTHPIIPPFQAWPDPTGGYKLRWYSLDVPKQTGRFGRIFRCTTFMVNIIDPRQGPRDPRVVSPHFHDDFEQCSLALQGEFTHHLRWPWTTDMTMWREDVHDRCSSPSVYIIPPPAIHTTTPTGTGLNQLVDIFAPPRMDFSLKPGWVLNEADYPMPAHATSTT